MSQTRVERDVVCFHSGLSDDVANRLIEAELRTPPVNFTRVVGPIIERLRCVEALLLGVDTVGIERYWEIVDVANLDKNWEN